MERHHGAGSVVSFLLKNNFFRYCLTKADLMAFILVDYKQVAGFDGVKSIIDQELLSARHRVIDLIAVMDMHIHCLFFFIQVRNRKGMRCGTLFD